MRRPIGSTPAKYLFASASLTITTGGARVLVARVEDAAAHERHAERREELVAHRHDRSDRCALIRRQHPPFDHEVVGDLQPVGRQADRQPHRAHPGQRVEALDQLVVEPAHLRVLRGMRARGSDSLEREQMPGIETRADALQAARSCGSSGRRPTESIERERDLGDDAASRCTRRWPRAEPPRPPSFSVSTSGVARARSAGARPNIDAADRRRRRARTGTTGTFMRTSARRGILSAQAPAARACPMTPARGRATPDTDGEDDALGQQLTDDAAPRPAPSAPRTRDLTLARRGAREQQVRDVRRRNQEQEPDRAEQHPQTSGLTRPTTDSCSGTRVERPVLRRRDTAASALR